MVTFATSHWLRSPLKTEALINTVARKERWLHSQSTRKKRRRKEEPWSEYCDNPQKANILQSTCVTPPTQTPDYLETTEEPWSNYRGRQWRQTQTSCTTNYSHPFSTYPPWPHRPPHLTPILPNSLSHACLCIISSPPNPKPQTIWTQPYLKQGPKSMKYHQEIS